jgi:hypothetical protein
MAIDFPNAPVNGSTYSYQGVKYTFIKPGIDTGYWAVLTVGTVDIATPAEVEAGTDNAKFMTPFSIEGSTYAKEAYADLKVNWRGEWTNGTYLVNDMVHDNGWLMVANTTTTERAAPSADGPPQDTKPVDPTWGFNLTHAEVIVSGSTITFTQGGWVKELQILVPDVAETITYQAYIQDITNPNDIVTEVITGLNLVADVWAIAAQANKVIPAGTVWRISLSAYNSADSSEQINDGWIFDGNDNVNDPASQHWNTDTNDSAFRADAQSLGQSYASQLANSAVGSIWKMSQLSDQDRHVEYRQESLPAITGTTYRYEYTVLSTGIEGLPQPGEQCIVTLTAQTANNTKAYSKTDYWVTTPQPSWGVIEGFLRVGGVDQVVPNNTHGTKVVFQPGILSTEWDVLISSANGGGTPDIESTTVVSSAPPPIATGSNTYWYNLDDGRLYIDVDDGTSFQWVLTVPTPSQAIAPVTLVSNAPPPSAEGTKGLWYNLGDGITYIDMNDGTSSQWVPSQPSRK